MSAAPPPASLRLVETIALRGETYHVQGIEVAGLRVWVTSVDQSGRRGLLSVFDLPGGAMLQSIEIHDGARYHPGGVSAEADSLWIPVAEYRPGGRSVIQRRSKTTLEILHQFPVADHIGCRP